MTFEEYASTTKWVSHQERNRAKIAWHAAILECIDILEKYEIPVGNSAAGEMACEMTYDALNDIRDEIRGLN